MLELKIPPLSANLSLNPIYSERLRAVQPHLSNFCTTKVLVGFGWICVVGVGLPMGREWLFFTILLLKHLSRFAKVAPCDFLF